MIATIYSYAWTLGGKNINSKDHIATSLSLCNEIQSFVTSYNHTCLQTDWLALSLQNIDPIHNIQVLQVEYDIAHTCTCTYNNTNTCIYIQ